ncbi:MAG: hypothetical protein ABI091_27485 [Ferruginibacter sp.]
MKITFYIIIICLVQTLFSCKKDLTTNGIIIKDCTGTYLRLNEKDYKVCNLEKVSSFQSDTNVRVTFKQLKNCEGTANSTPICYLLHQYVAWIEIEDIN